MCYTGQFEKHSGFNGFQQVCGLELNVMDTFSMAFDLKP